jgi:hypothetical protein
MNKPAIMEGIQTDNARVVRRNTYFHLRLSIQYMKFLQRGMVQSTIIYGILYVFNVLRVMEYLRLLTGVMLCCQLSLDGPEIR